ncbi:MAG: CapA family protein [Candidatus Ryanbacteria bacterium]|nr:CapA family protein [Candidatus Ryanbacteria bacterium]
MILRSSTRRIFAPLFFGGLAGFAIFYAVHAMVDMPLSRVFTNEQTLVEKQAAPKLYKEEFFYTPLASRIPEIPETGKAVVADLSLMQTALYEDGELVDELPIVSKGKPGSFWETPTGTYRVLSKEESHFSSIGSVFMPYSIGFFGNFFIHGWPTYPSGKAVAQGFSGGCIRMATSDAKKVYDFVERETPIIVLESDGAEVDEVTYLELLPHRPAPKVSAGAYLVADLDNNFVFAEKNRNVRHPIASIAKLMTGVVSLEAINQEREILITDSDLDIYGDSGSLVKDETFIAKDLLAPLLLSSSNDAAFALARTTGRARFVDLMNEKADALGLVGTEFTDPAGLEMSNVSTPDDLIGLIKYIRDQRAPMLELSRKRYASLNTNKGKHTWYNFNWKNAGDEFLGGKVGYTSAARHTMIGLFSLPLAEFAKRNVGIAVLDSEDEERDVKKLIEWVGANFVYGSTKAAVSARKDQSPMPIETPDVRMLFVGDIMLNRGIETKIKSIGGGDFSFPFEYVKSVLAEPDITFGNLEGPISDKGTKHGSIYSFRMEPDSVKALFDMGFDVVSLANNHMGDFGREAMEDTFRRLRRAGIAYAGAGWNGAEAASPAILERGGLKIGFLAFSDVGSAWLKAGESLSGLALASKEDVQEAVRRALLKTDILIVSFHFGEEYETTSRARQRELAHAAIDAGAKIVVGHHPHVAQEVEEYNGGLIAYSLGNFIFDQAFSEDTKKALMLEVQLKGQDVKTFKKVPIIFNDNFQPMVQE